MELPDISERCRVHYIEGYISNIFLFEYPEGMFCLDGGVTGDARRVRDYCLNVLHRPLKDIKFSLVSHTHPDHVGCAVTLRRKYGIPIAGHERLGAWYSGLGGRIQHMIDCYLTFRTGHRQGRRYRRIFFPPRCEPDFKLVEGSRLPFFSDWQVLHVPGHTIHDIALFHRDSGVLCAADAVIDVRSRYFLPIPVMYPGELKRSYERLSNLGVTSMLLAHGNTVPGENTGEVFLQLKSLLDEPPSAIARRTEKLFRYSPEVRGRQ